MNTSAPIFSALVASSHSLASQLLGPVVLLPDTLPAAQTRPCCLLTNDRGHHVMR